MLATVISDGKIVVAGKEMRSCYSLPLSEMADLLFFKKTPLLSSEKSAPCYHCKLHMCCVRTVIKGAPKAEQHVKSNVTVNTQVLQTKCLSELLIHS